jgi:hypothetical protein
LVIVDLFSREVIIEHVPSRHTTDALKPRR